MFGHHERKVKNVMAAAALAYLPAFASSNQHCKVYGERLRGSSLGRKLPENNWELYLIRTRPAPAYWCSVNLALHGLLSGTPKGWSKISSY